MNHFKLPSAATIIGLIVLSVTFIGQRVLVKRNFPEKPMQIVLDRNVPLVSLIAGDDETVGKLRKGDTVDYLGVVAGNHHHPYGLLVQTRDGERGLLAAAENNGVQPHLFADIEKSGALGSVNLRRERTRGPKEHYIIIL